MWVSPDDRVFAGGFDNGAGKSVIAYYNGSSWTSSLLDSGYQISNGAIWGTAYDNVYAVEMNDADSRIYHFDGSAWTLFHEVPAKKLYHIWGLDANNIYVSGSDTILYYDGSWREISPPGTRIYEGVWGVAANDLLAFGSGFYGTYDGSGWTIYNLSNSYINGVWGSSTGYPIFGAGHFGYPPDITNNLFKYNEGWEVVTGTPSNTHALYAIWGASSEFFAVGNMGTVLHYQ